MVVQGPDTIDAAPQLEAADSSSILRWLLGLVLIAAVIAVVVLGVTAYRSRIASTNPVFSPETQHVPEGTASLAVPAALSAFGLSAPLPFFEEKNVVQSLNLAGSAASAGTAPFLSYRVFGQETAAIRSAYETYFKTSGWEVQDTGSEGALVFLSERQILSVSVMEVQTPDMQKHVVVALSPL